MAAATNNTTAASAAANPPPPTTNISPIKKTKSTTSSSNKSPSKQSTTKSSDVKSTSKKSPTKKSSSNNTTNSTSSTAQTEKQLKLQKAEIAKRELKELESMERAFRQDMDVWAGPSNVVFPRRYHSLVQLKHNGNSNNATAGGGGNSGRGGGSKQSKKKGEKEGNTVYYGSQSQGWMYGDGLARMGGLSWMDVTTPPTTVSSASTSSNSKRKKSSDGASTKQQKQQKQQQSKSGFLVDDVSIIDKSLTAAGLTRSHLTPRAYACLLEQARRYTLELLADAQDYALHAQRDSIASLLPSDICLAVEMREDTHGVSSTLPRVEDVQCVAEEVNRVPLPAIPRDCYGGVVLPPVEEQLTARTFDVVNGARVVQRMMRGGDYPMGLSEVGNLGKKGGGGGGGGGRRTGSYGAAMGRQISVNLKSGGSKGGDEKKSKGGGAAGGGDASASAAASKASSGTKGQKRKLTEL